VKTQIVKASVSRKESGKFFVSQEFVLDATEEFKSAIIGMEDEDEIMSKFGDYDFVKVDKDKIETDIVKAIEEKHPGLSFYTRELIVYVSSEVGYPTDSTKMEDIWEAAKNIWVTVEANFEYTFNDFETFETELAKAVITQNPGKTTKTK